MLLFLSSAQASGFIDVGEILFNPFGAKKPQSPDQPARIDQPGRGDQHGWMARLKRGLATTRTSLLSGLNGVFSRTTIDAVFYDDLETLLISSDVGVRAARTILDDLRRKAKEKRITLASDLETELRHTLVNMLTALEKPLVADGMKPFVILIAGVNGAGKTTTIGKLAKYFQAQGKSVLLAAGDTFRAAAREQLMTWGERNNVTVVAQEGGDAAAVIFDAIQSAKARGIDIVLADTAGRLPTQLHLMDEISKIKRVIGKAFPGAPHETLLVLDANTGQNGIAQVKAFDQALQVSGLVVTKLDGTAKGGVIAALACEQSDRIIPVRFIGVGEGIEDLQPFVAQEFVDALFQ